MDELTSYSTINTVDQLTNVINTELNRAAISFVRVGYLLKRARDENILKDSGYPDIYTYANMKFGLDKSQVSRFININDRYSIGGYSEHLKEEYEGYGYSKLALMLTLPEEINGELSPDFSKRDINAIKSEYEAEQKISDLEVMMEEKPDGPDDFLAMVIKELNDEHPESATYLNTTIKIAEKLGVIVEEQDIREAYIPEGTAAYFIRISGRGRYEIGMKESGIVIINMRDPADKTSMTWEEFKECLMKDMEVREFPEEDKKPERRNNDKVKPAKPAKPAKPKENRYVEEVRKYHEQEEVAPVQQEEKVEETAKTQNEEAPERIPEEDTGIIPAKTEIIPAGQCMDNDPQEESKAAAGDVIEKDTMAAGDAIEEPMPEEVKLADEARMAEEGPNTEKATMTDEVPSEEEATMTDEVPSEEEATMTDEVPSEEKATMAAGGSKLTSAQSDMIEWLDLIRRKVVPEDGSRPDWISILDELKTMERYVKQFTY